MMNHTGKLSEDILAMKLKWHDREPGVIEHDKVRYSSVLVPLIETNGQLEVLFEVRASSLKRQPGEVCFPGGGVEEGESYEDTAVRETMEELLISRDQIEVLAPLDYLEAHGGATVVRPYLGLLKEYRGTYSEDEVDHVFTVPFSWFLSNAPERFTTTVQTIPDEDFPFERVPGGRNYHWKKVHYDVYFYQYENETIWGMTAKILYAFIKLYHGEKL